MIIACPECTQPFQVEDGDIAPLVQIECPHCVFRMILDFEAANDASLIEAGMQMAQGFSTESEYRMAVGAGTVAFAAEPSSAAPHLVAVPQPEPEPEVVPEPARKPEPVARKPEPEPEPEIAKPPVRVPRTEPASERPAARLPTPEPSPPEPASESDKPPVRIKRAHFEPAPEQTSPPTRAPRATLIAHTAPPPALRPPGQTGAQPPVSQDVDVDIDMDEPQPSADARHSPPHTPPVIAPIARVESVARDGEVEPPTREVELPSHPAADSQSRPIEAREAEPDPEDTDKKKPSIAGTVFKVILLLLLLSVAGVMVWSLIETGNPNPLPMLQERFGISIPGL